MPKFLIEMEIPADMDPSALLERMQELAVEFANEFPEVDDEGEDIEVDEQAVSDTVSVSEKPAKQTATALSVYIK